MMYICVRSGLFFGSNQGFSGFSGYFMMYLSNSYETKSLNPSFFFSFFESLRRYFMIHTFHTP